MNPLVSVICLCYNHERFIREALDSVLNQTYPNLEIIIVDDLSQDNSRKIILEYVKRYPQIRYIFNEKNLRNCAAFNKGYEISRGEFIVDFATDDVLLPTRIEEQVRCFQNLGPDYGVIFTDAELIDNNSKHISFFYKRNPDGSLKSKVPTGDIFADVLSRYFISSPTMLMRRRVFEELNGYDASLAYEDFDFWVRSSRRFKYYFLDKPLTKRRIHATQLSAGWYKPHDPQLLSTIKVCRKALQLCRNMAELQALLVRIKFEVRQAVFSENYLEAEQLFRLYREVEKPTLVYRLLERINSRKLKLAFLRNLYHWLRYK